MSFLRNTFAVLLGLGVAMLIITIGLRINSEWITYSGFTPFEKWSRLLEDMRGNSCFFVALLVSTGIASTIGGITTAFIVKSQSSLCYFDWFYSAFFSRFRYYLFRIPPYFLSDRNISYDISFFLGWRKNYRSYL